MDPVEGVIQGISGSVSFTLDGIASSVVDGAIGNWNTGCGNDSLPDMTIGGDAEFLFNVVLQPTIPSGHCGRIDPTLDANSAADGFDTRITGGTITIAVNSSIGSCDLQESLTHELGHMLGLGHTPIQCAQDGLFEIMLQGVQDPRSVQPGDCEQAEESNPPESDEPDEEDDPDELEENPCNDETASSSIWGVFRYGDLPEKVVNPCGGGGTGGDGDVPIQINWNSPIVVNLNHGGFKFTDIENGVEFDMDGTGIRVQMSWTDPDEGDSFLGLDRNGNGMIDDGQELFGNFSEQPASENPNGYLALAVFDKPEKGGNGDGVISYEDAVYGDLLLWIDANQNGFSEFYELIPLGESGVEELNLAYVVSERHDNHGNLIPFKSTARLENGGVIQTCDVFFLSYVEE